jgi:hypothetical protein
MKSGMFLGALIMASTSTSVPKKIQKQSLLLEKIGVFI